MPTKILFHLISLFCTITVFAENQTIRICRPNNMVSALFYIAESAKLFETEGLTPEFQTTTNGKLCQDTMLARKSDFLMTAEGPFTYIAQYNPPIKIIATTQKNPETAIFARKDSGIKSFADLKGKRLGYLPGTVSYFFLTRILEKNSIAKTDLKLTAMQPPTMPSALIGGAIDAFSMWEPWGAQAGAVLKDNFIILEDTAAYQYESILLAHQEILDSNPEQAKKLLRVLKKALKYLNENQEVSFDILTTALKFDPIPLRRLWNKYDHSVGTDASVVNLMSENFKILQAEDLNFKDIPLPDFNKYLDFSYLNSIEDNK